MEPEDGGGASRSTDPASGTSAATDVSLREYIGERFRSDATLRAEQIRAHAAMHEQENVARSEAAKRIDDRLEGLNELRREVLTDRERFVSREAFEAKLEAIDARLAGLHDQMTEWKGRNKGMSLITSIVVGAVGFLATISAIYFAFN